MGIYFIGYKNDKTRLSLMQKANQMGMNLVQTPSSDDLYFLTNTNTDFLKFTGKDAYIANVYSLVDNVDQLHLLNSGYDNVDFLIHVDDFDYIVSRFGLPFVYKDMCGKVELVTTQLQFANLTRSETSYIVEKYIRSSFGKSFKVFCVGGEAKFSYEYTNNYDFDSTKGKVASRGLNSVLRDDSWYFYERTGLWYFTANYLISKGGNLIFTGVSPHPEFAGLETKLGIDISTDILNFVKSRFDCVFN